MATLRQFSVRNSSVASAAWPMVKDAINPMIWEWYDAHKDQVVTKLYGFITVRIGSFGIAEMILNNIFGPRRVSVSDSPQG